MRLRKYTRVFEPTAMLPLVLSCILLSMAPTPMAAEATSESPDAEHDSMLFSLQHQLGQCQHELESARRQAAATPTSAATSFLGQVCQWRGASSDPGSTATLRQTVRRFLRATRLDEADDGRDREVAMTVRLSRDDLVSLRRFLLNDEGRVEAIQDILSGSWQPGPVPASSSSTWPWPTLQEAHLAWLAAALLAALLCRGVPAWRVAVLFSVGSVAWTWVHLYKVALSKKRATLSRLSDVPRACLIEQRGWWGAWADALHGLVGGGARDARCEAYYEALLVDPVWEVTPLRALSETLTQLVLRPLEGLGAAAGAFYRDILEPVPLLWKLPVLLCGTVLIVLLLLMACRYKVKSPWLFSIEPTPSPALASSGRRKAVKNADLDSDSEDNHDRHRDPNISAKRVTFRPKAVKNADLDSDSEDNHDHRRDQNFSAKRVTNPTQALPYPTEPTWLDHLVDRKH